MLSNETMQPKSEKLHLGVVFNNFLCYSRLIIPTSVDCSEVCNLVMWLLQMKYLMKSWAVS